MLSDINKLCYVVIIGCLITTALAGFKTLSEGSGLIPFLPISDQGTGNVNNDNERDSIPNPVNHNIPAPTIL